jgi:nucleoside-diphosphate-sugar epimerase
MQNVSVLATSSQLKNVKKLNEQGIKAQQLVLPATMSKLSQHDVFTQQCLVIAITPKFKQGQGDYAVKVAQLVDAAEQRGIVKRIVLLSSTAVYHGLAGIVDESSTLDLAGSTAQDKVQILHEAEQSVLNFYNLGNVLRLAGLVGPERHPGKFILANRTLKNVMAPVNLIHQQDAVGLISSLLTSVSSKGIFNGVSDTHVTKLQYYQAAAKAIDQVLPSFFSDNMLTPDRIVSGTKAKQQLDYSFIYPDLLDWL